MDNLDRAIQADLNLFLRKSFNRVGIEKTEDLINEHYKNLPKLKSLYLAEYNKLTRKEWWRMNLFELSEQHLKNLGKDYDLLNIIDTAVYIRRRLDKIEYDKQRYERRKIRWARRKPGIVCTVAKN